MPKRSTGRIKCNDVYMIYQNTMGSDDIQLLILGRRVKDYWVSLSTVNNYLGTR